MPWLAELVESSEGSLDMLPVQCLCEFLLHETQDVVRDGLDDESIKFEKHKKSQVQIYLYFLIFSILYIYVKFCFAHFFMQRYN